MINMSVRNIFLKRKNNFFFHIEQFLGLDENVVFFSMIDLHMCNDLELCNSLKSLANYLGVWTRL
jgi:hypothetical protein